MRNFVFSLVVTNNCLYIYKNKNKQKQNIMTYINEYGVKTSKKLDRIIMAAQNHTRRNFNGNKLFCDFLGTKRMTDLRTRFDVEVENIGGVDYTFGDCLA